MKETNQDLGLKTMIAVVGAIVLALLVVIIIALLPLIVIAPLPRLGIRLILRRDLAMAGFVFNLTMIAAYMLFRGFAKKWSDEPEMDDTVARIGKKPLRKALPNILTILAVCAVVGLSTGLNLAYYSGQKWLAFLNDYIWAAGFGVLAERSAIIWDHVTFNVVKKILQKRGIELSGSKQAEDFLKWLKNRHHSEGR